MLALKTMSNNEMILQPDNVFLREIILVFLCMKKCNRIKFNWLRSTHGSECLMVSRQQKEKGSLYH